MSDLPSKSAANAVDEQAYERAQEVIAEKPKRKWQSYIWDTFDKSPEERKFLFKIDTALLTLASLGGSLCIWVVQIINSTFQVTFAST